MLLSWRRSAPNREKLIRNWFFARPHTQRCAGEGECSSIQRIIAQTACSRSRLLLRRQRRSLRRSEGSGVQCAKSVLGNSSHLLKRKNFAGADQSEFV